MRPAETPVVKICCISSPEEARAAIEAGASALGLVSRMPSGPGVISEVQIAEIAAAIPPGIASFLLTSLREPAAIIEQVRRAGVSTVQICDRLDLGSVDRLAEALPDVTLVQVVHVTGAGSVDEALAAAPHVDALLLDSGNPSLPVKELGGTGRIHDWKLSAKIREHSPVPVYLAGGLHPGNVAEAIRVVGPHGLDVCSGVRTGGRLDAVKLAAFFAEIRILR